MKKVSFQIYMKIRNLNPNYNSDNKTLSIAVFLSGTGTNFEYILKEQRRLEKTDKPYGRIDVVFTNVPNCKGTTIAEENNIKVISLSSKKFLDKINKAPEDEEGRVLYDMEAIKLIESFCKPDLIVLAGYRRKLSKVFFNKYRNRIINLYPGDITKNYLIKGVPGVIQAIRNKETEIKCSVYIQKENERFGPLIAQSEPISIDGFNEDDIEILSNKIRELGEWKLFSYVIHELIANGKVEIDTNGNVEVRN